MRTPILVSIWTILFGFISLFFTNCQQQGFESKWSGSATHEGSSQIPNESENPDRVFPDTPAPAPGEEEPSGFLDFQAGYQLKLDHVPTQNPYVLSHFEAYMLDTGYKAIAISATGEGFLSYAVGSAVTFSKSQTEANRRALEGCFIKSDGKPCAVFAEGNTIKYSVDALLNAMRPSFLPVLDAAYAPAKVPWVTDSLRAGILKNYSAFSNSKALALSLSGAGCYREGHTTEAEAGRRALQCCEWASKGETCVLFAVNNKVVFDIKEHYFPQDLSMPIAPATFDASKIPFVSSAARATLGKAYVDYVNTTSTPVALALNDLGDWAFRTGATAAQARKADKAACASSGDGGKCLVYAIDNDVVLTREKLRSL